MTCKQRRQCIISFQARVLFKRAAEANTEDQRVAAKQQANALLRCHRQTLELQQISRHIRCGRTLTKTTKLHKIEAIVVDNTTLLDPTDWLDPLLSYYQGKFETANIEERKTIVDFTLRHQHHDDVQVNIDDLLIAMRCIKKHYRYDRYGICVGWFYLWARAQPHEAITFISTASGVANHRCICRHATYKNCRSIDPAAEFRTFRKSAWHPVPWYGF